MRRQRIGILRRPLSNWGCLANFPFALSPCPNDTFLVCGWASGEVGQDRPPELIFEDIERLNERALAGISPLVKLSFPTFAKVLKSYELLPVGSAICPYGPKLIGKAPFLFGDLPQKRVAIPGRGTSAHALLNQLLPPPLEKVFCLFHEVFDLLQSGRVDAAVVIHEKRMTFLEEGYCEIADLGLLWQERTGLPVPLGGLAIARALPYAQKRELLEILQASLAWAESRPFEELLPFLKTYSQDQRHEVIAEHVRLYVNEETRALSPLGKKAILTLLKGCHADASTLCFTP